MPRTVSPASIARLVAFVPALVLATASTAARADPSQLAPEVGWNQGQLETARTAAMAGATSAIGPDVSGLFANPANMAVTRVYHLQALGQIWPEANRQSYGAAAVDSVTSRVAGGLGGTYTIQDPDGLARKATDVRLALAFPVSERLFFGGAAKYLQVHQGGSNAPFGKPDYASGGLDGKAILTGFTFDAGLAVKPADVLYLGLVGTNLTNPGNGFRPLGLTGGIGVGTADFSLEGDVSADFTTYTKTSLRYMGGAELLAADHVPLRGGYRYDDGLKAHSVSGGVGYVDQQFALEVAVRRIVSGPGATTIVIGLSYFLESSGLTKSGMDFE